MKKNELIENIKKFLEIFFNCRYIYRYITVNTPDFMERKEKR